MTSADISSLVERSAANNKENDITELLIATGEVFFQILEGPDDRNRIVAKTRQGK